MLNKLQKQTFVKMVQQNQHILFAKVGPNVTRKKKGAVWTAIFHRLQSLGADLPSVRSVRDFEWGNLKRAAMKRQLENRMTDLDKIVIDIINGGSSNEDDSMALASSVYENGVDHQDGENIVVTPTLFETNGDPMDHHLHTSRSSLHMSLHDLSASEQESFYHHSSMECHDGYDPELNLAKKKKLESETSLLKLQIAQIKEKTRLARELQRTTVLRLQADIQNANLKSEKLNKEIEVLKLQADEIRARTALYSVAKESMILPQTKMEKILTLATENSFH